MRQSVSPPQSSWSLHNTPHTMHPAHAPRMLRVAPPCAPALLDAPAAVFMSPYFAYLGHEHSPWMAYMTAGVFFWLLICMSNIQNILENPFITFGKTRMEDDINLDNLKGLCPLPSCFVLGWGRVLQGSIRMAVHRRR